MPSKWIRAAFSAVAIAAGGTKASACATTFTIEPFGALVYQGQSVTGTVRFTATTGSFNGSCMLGYSLGTWQTVHALTHTQNPQATLPYSIGSPFWHSGLSYRNQFQVMQRQVVTIDMPVTIPANFLGRPAGTYRQIIPVDLMNTVVGGTLATQTLVMNVTVPSTCTLPPPSQALVDFSGAVDGGEIRVPYQQSISFSNAGCTGPARLSLSALPLRAEGNAGDTIHFAAAATLGSTSVTLDTRVAETSFATQITAAESGIIPLSITALPTTGTLAAGTYSSTLRVRLEPAQ